MCFSRYALYGLVAFAQHDYLLLCMQILCIITHLTPDEYHYLKTLKMTLQYIVACSSTNGHWCRY